jgi:hypothetical protein
MKIYDGILLHKIGALVLACTMISSCSSKAVRKGMLVITEVPGNIKDPDSPDGISWHYLPGARISAMYPGRGTSLKLLTKTFFSACDPDISYDGRFMLFAGQQKQDERWQIWEMNLDNLTYRQITTFNEDCTDPLYLPGNRLVFSKLTTNDTVKTAHCLFTCNLDGSGVQQITFSPNTWFATRVLKDGRLLTISRQLMPGQYDPMLMVMRPDGTKADMFYKGPSGSAPISRPNETSDGKIVFIESFRRDRVGGWLVSINYNRPLHTHADIAPGIAGDFCAVLPLKPDKYLVSWRVTDSEPFGLYEFDPIKKSIGVEVLKYPDFNITDVFPVREFQRPRKLPSEVDMQVKTGLLLCQDINFLSSPGSSVTDTGKAMKIEVLGVDTTYGVVQVEKDGSFQLKVMADKPFRIRTLDNNGNVVNGPCSWLWLRPNERRGCVGCHEDPELVPENKVSMAIRKAPVIIPVHITEVKEKIVDLE